MAQGFASKISELGQLMRLKGFGPEGLSFMAFVEIKDLLISGCEFMVLVLEGVDP